MNPNEDLYDREISSDDAMQEDQLIEDSREWRQTRLEDEHFHDHPDYYDIANDILNTLKP